MGTKPWQNSEGYSDPTAYEGLKPVIREDEEQQRRLNNLIFVLKYIIRLAGFELLNRIIPKLEKRDAGYQARWGKIWEDALCQKYKRPDQEEHWIWNHDFYNGPVEDLRYIAALIGA